MGINMDIRNEPKFSFLDLQDLDEAVKNEIAEILRLDTSSVSLKLPWDIGEKEYERTSEIVENPAEDTSASWQSFEMPSYEVRYEQSTSMMTAAMQTSHQYPQMTYTMSEYPPMGNAYGTSGAGDPNMYPYMQRIPYGPGQPIYSSNQPELMNQGPPPSRESDKRGSRNRGGKRGGDAYNRQINTNNDMQTSYIVQGQHQYGPIVPICHATGGLYPVQGIVAQPHPAVGTPIFIQQGSQSNYSQGPPMHHNSHQSYVHHQSSYPSHSHSTNNTKYMRNSTGQTTYYNQESPKNLHKHYDKRANQQHDLPPPPFRHSSSINHSNNTNNTNDVEPPKRTAGKPLIVNTSNAVTLANTNNSVSVTIPSRPVDHKKIIISQPKTEIIEPRTVKNDRHEDVKEKKQVESTVASHSLNNNASSNLKDKPAVQDKEVAVVREVKVAPVKAPVEIPPKTVKVIESTAEHNEVVAPPTKNIPEPAVKSAENSSTPVATTPSAPATTSIFTPPTPSPPSWASVVFKKPGPTPADVKPPTPITKLTAAAAAAPPVNFSSPSAKPLTTKISTPEIPPKTNDNAGLTTHRNNVDTSAKVPETSPWADNKTTHETPQNSLNDPAVFRMGELLLKYQMEKQIVSLLPRGLTNRSNYCYINSILQALLACPPFYNLLMALPHPKSTVKNSSTPLIDNMVRFVHEFTPLAEAARMPRKDKSQKRGDETAVDVHSGVAFEPSYVYTMLKNTSCAGGFSVEGRQEDAEEFLSCLLNGISDEMLELMKLVNAESKDNKTSNPAESNVNFSNAEEGWKVMGPKNKGSITRCTEFARTPLSDIFRGQLRSRVLRTGDETTDNVQPFFTLQLDIEKAESVEAALEILVGKDQVEGMTCSKTKQQIEAWKQVLLEELPIILILHLKWFDYKLDGCSKIFKRVGFPIDLKLDGKLLSQNVAKKLTRKQRQYKLFAVTYHDGKEATKGHYVTDAFHVGYNAWVRYDDSSVKGINEENVLNPSPPRVPYLLYYKRCDAMANNQSITTRTR